MDDSLAGETAVVAGRDIEAVIDSRDEDYGAHLIDPGILGMTNTTLENNNAEKGKDLGKLTQGSSPQAKAIHVRNRQSTKATKIDTATDKDQFSNFEGVIGKSPISTSSKIKFNEQQYQVRNKSKSKQKNAYRENKLNVCVGKDL